MTAITLYEGDNRDHLRRLIADGVRVHSVITDPPYGLTSVTKRFGGDAAAPAKFGTDGAFARASAGFMGSKWDGTGIERDPEFWRLIWEILLPGGYVAAFSSPRTGHWQAVAMEMAGFVLHPFAGWCYGTGFPKAHNAAMAIDKALGVAGDRVAIGTPVARMIPGADQNATGSWIKDNGELYQPGRYVPDSPQAAAWQGWAYGGQSSKPALEPIYVGQRPFSEKTGALNLLKHGVGAVNIDGCRVPMNGEVVSCVQGQSAAQQSGKMYSGKDQRDQRSCTSHDLGRHPANLFHDGSAEVVAMFPQTASGKPGVMRKGTNDGACYGTESRAPGTPMTGFGDAGSAARFFNCFPPDVDPLIYQAKATKADRAGSRHPTVKPVALLQHLVRHYTPPGGVVLDPFAGSGTTAEAARREGFDCVLMEAETAFADDIRRRFDLPRADSVSTAYDDILGGADVGWLTDLLG